jgi:predicted Zn-dependent protease
VSAAAEAGDADLALRTADALVALDPASPNHRLTRAGVLMDRGEWDRAAADCRAAVAAHPLSSLSRVSLAVCLARLGDAPAALRELDLALALAPDDQTRAEHRDFFRARAR